MHRIISGMYPNIDEKFKELWEQRFSSLIELMKSGRWILSARTRFFFLGYHEWIESLCKYKDFAILFMIPKNCSSTEGVWVDMEDLSSRYPCRCYSCDCSSRYKMEYPILVPIEELFPLFATNYLQAQVGEGSDCRFLAARPTRCHSRYKDAKDTYLRLIKALGEVENENKAEG